MCFSIRILFFLVEATVLAIIKKKNQTVTSIREDMQKLELLCTLGRIVNGTAVMENLMAVLQKIKNMI